MQIHIQQGEGITHGIKRALEQNGTDTSKINGNIWYQVMQEVSTENSTRESNNKIYEGGSDLSGSYKDNFVVKLATGATEKIIELAQTTWNKIVSLVTGNETPVKVKTEPPQVKPEQPQVKPEPLVEIPVEVETEPPVSAPAAGDVVAVQNENGTTYQINSKEHTITKLDADGNVIEKRAMTEEEQNLSTNELIQNLQKPTVPAQATEVKPEPPAEAPGDDGQKKLSQEQIQQKA